MRFLLNVLHDREEFATESEMAAIGVFNAELRESGAFVMACGLAWPGEAQVIDARGDRVVVESGPAVTAGEFVSGFWIIETPEEGSAAAISERASRACNRRIELRSLLG